MKIENFRNAFQSLSSSVVSSEFFGGIIESGTALLNIFTSLTESIGALGVAAAGIGLYQGLSGKGGGETIRKSPDVSKMTYATEEFSGDVYELRFSQ